MHTPRSESHSEKISIITATYNCADRLPELMASLRNQTDRDFEWVVCDGASTDGTLELLQSVTGLNVVMSSQADFGIYDALNRAIGAASGSYYIVVGADDQLHSDAIARFRGAIEQERADMIVADVAYGRHLFRVKRAPSWLVGEKAFIAHHSVATAFRRDLHARFGLYSRKFPIAADSLFVLRACKAGATRYRTDFVAGTIGGGGVSAVDSMGSATELFRVQLLNGCALIPQVLLLLLRILKGSSSRVRALHDTLFFR